MTSKERFQRQFNNLCRKPMQPSPKPLTRLQLMALEESEAETMWKELNGDKK